MWGRSLGGVPIWGRSAVAARHLAVALCRVLVFPHQPIQLQRIHSPDATLDVPVVFAVVRLDAFLSLAAVLADEYGDVRRLERQPLLTIGMSFRFLVGHDRDPREISNAPVNWCGSVLVQSFCHSHLWSGREEAVMSRAPLPDGETMATAALLPTNMIGPAAGAI